MKYITILLSVIIVAIVGCAGNPNSSLAKQCDSGLDIAYKALDYSKAIYYI